MWAVKIFEPVGESPVGWEDTTKQRISEPRETLKGTARIRVIESNLRGPGNDPCAWLKTDTAVMSG